MPVTLSATITVPRMRINKTIIPLSLVGYDIILISTCAWKSQLNNYKCLQVAGAPEVKHQIRVPG